MRAIKMIILALILVAIVILAIANRDPVTVNLLPDGMSRLMPGASINLPLFLVCLISIVVGLVIGYLFEYLRETKHRRRAKENARRAAKLDRDVDRLRRQTNTPEDDVLALVNN